MSWSGVVCAVTPYYRVLASYFSGFETCDVLRRDFSPSPLRQPAGPVCIYDSPETGDTDIPQDTG